jgi:hypothetical protein
MSNTKWYSVKVKTTVDYFVEVEDDGECYGDSYNEAIEFASDECREFDSIEASVISGKELEIALRAADADKVSYI